MKVSEIYDAIRTGNREHQQQAMFEILAIAQVTAIASHVLLGV